MSSHVPNLSTTVAAHKETQSFELHSQPAASETQKAPPEGRALCSCRGRIAPPLYRSQPRRIAISASRSARSQRCQSSVSNVVAIPLSEGISNNLSDEMRVPAVYGSGESCLRRPELALGEVGGGVVGHEPIIPRREPLSSLRQRKTPDSATVTGGLARSQSRYRSSGWTQPSE
jgi:hypothetical protein